MSTDATTAFARTLVDEWVRGGVRDACVAPGSRNAPLTLALAHDGRIRLHVHLDERSAGFFALGCARASSRPVVVTCTSGTAAAHLHPAVLEAAHGAVPLVVCTADRPAELRDTGAGQTIDQVGLYGDVPRWSCDVDPPADRPGVGAWWRALAARSVAAAAGPPAGPVHLNLAFRDPLAPTGEPLVEAPGRDGGAPWTANAPAARHLSATARDELVDDLRRARRGVVLAGWGADVAPATARRFSAATGWPVLADPLSGLRVDGTIGTYDLLLRHPPFAAAHRPDRVLAVGAPLTSAVATRWGGSAPRRLIVDPHDRWLDPTHSATGRLPADPEPLLDDLARALNGGGDDGWAEGWQEAERAARRAVDDTLERSEDPTEPRAARDLARVLPDGSTLVVASSMPVRDLEAFAEPRAGVRYLANRGVNGIDGVVSTTLGVAAAAPGPTVALVGDLCFLHDVAALVTAPPRGIDTTFVVVDNGGGGIFSFLPYAGRVPDADFESVLATPPGVDLAALVTGAGIHLEDVEKASALGAAVLGALDAGGLQVVRVRSDRAENVERHEELWRAVAGALDQSGR